MQRNVNLHKFKKNNMTVMVKCPDDITGLINKIVDDE